MSDRFGDPLPRHALARVGTIRAWAGPKRVMTSTPDGTLVATAGRYEPIRLWDAATARTWSRPMARVRS